MATFGDLERAAANLYEYRFLIGAVTLLAIAGALAYGYRRGWHHVVAAHRVPFAVAGAPVLAVGLFLAWSLASPLFTNVTVEEEFPFAQNAVVPSGMERGDVEMVLAGMAMVDDDAMAESMSSMSDDMATTTSADAASNAAASAATGVVQAVKTGSFRDADSFHRGSGQATLYATGGGAHVLRLEELQVTNGPALHVILSPHPNPSTPDDVKQPNYADLGPLKGNRGNQNYPIPPEVDIADIHSVVIYCKPFSVVFSVASLEG